MSTNQQISDYIYFYPDAMDTKTCNEIIKHYEKNAEWEESTFANEYGHTWGNKSVSMHQFWIGQPLPYFNELRDTFKYCTDDYMSVFERIGSVQSTDFRMNRYTKGGFMREHVDNIHYSHGQKLGYPHLTTLIFLNGYNRAIIFFNLITLVSEPSINKPLFTFPKKFNELF